jgi:hypothetical protein
MPPEGSRKSRRTRTFLGAKLVFQDFSRFVLCTVRDRSETGVRLELPVTQPVPTKFYLLLTKQRLAYEAQTLWRVGISMGVKLLSELDLNSPTIPKSLKSLLDG